jgi:hypothetical protein
MPTDFPLVESFLTRFEAELLFNVLPSVKLRSKIDACDVALRYLHGTPGEVVRRASHGNLNESSARMGHAVESL